MLVKHWDALPVGVDKYVALAIRPELALLRLDVYPCLLYTSDAADE